MSDLGRTPQLIPQAPPLRELVHTQLESLIVDGALLPGSKLGEVELAQTLGVSRGPIREALQLLAQDGFVDLRPRQGAFVHESTRTEVEDFYDVRLALETLSAQLAAQRAIPDDHRRLREHMQRALEILDRGDDPSAAENRVPIHALIAEIAGNQLLRGLLASLDKRNRWYMAPFESGARRQEWDEHGAVVDAIISGDPQRAGEAMREHIVRSRESYLRLELDA